MSKYLIGLDDGHGMETAGKRTCPLKEDVVFRGKTFKKGSIIHENDFNENLMELVEKALDRCGIGHVQLAEGDSDIPLATRVKTANAKKCDLVVSFHANAMGSNWQEKYYGLVVIHHYNCQAKTLTLAKNCYKYLSTEVDWYSNGATKYGVRADKDVSGYSLYILKNTNAPAILIEYGFMDNWEDVKKMITPKFQQECAEATVKGICDTLGVKYVAPTSATPSSFTVKIIYKGKEGLNIRKGPSTSYAVTGVVKEGEVFTIVETKDNWGRLKSEVGWISLAKDYVEIR